MLRNLHIKNIALIREADVDFAGGLNILTGETGAGKSIIVDSVSLALGGRVQRDFLKGDGSAALIELVFEVESDKTAGALKEAGVTPEDGVVLISRKLLDGRSTCRINGETVTLSEMRAVGELLLDIHGQSEHQKLLRSEHQMELLDEYGREEIGPARAEVAEDYAAYARIRKALSGEELSEAERQRQISFLEYEIEEIDDAAPVSGEDEELESRYRLLANARKITDAVEEVHAAAGYDDADSAGERIGRALKTLESVSGYDARLADLCAQLSEIDDLLNDFNRDLSSYAGDLTDESGSFEETGERLNLINRLKQKYGRTVDEILLKREEMEHSLGELRDYEENRRKLKEELKEAEASLERSSGKLTGLRKKWAERFASEAGRQFRELNFAMADFGIEFGRRESYGPGGVDTVEFCIATNPGEMRKPLRSVVSGGELSRLMLGIRTMFADADEAGTIIFDEVDAGISGRTAQKVAEKMARVAARHQVLCITHLPQIAAMADTHYGITKEVSMRGAETTIEALSDEESAGEIARLIGGAEITDNTLRSAREMMAMCRQFKDSVL